MLLDAAFELRTCMLTQRMARLTGCYAAIGGSSDCPHWAVRVDAGVPAKGDLVIKLGQDGGGATSTPHQPANAGFAPSLRLIVGECG